MIANIPYPGAFWASPELRGPPDLRGFHGFYFHPKNRVIEGNTVTNLTKYRISIDSVSIWLRTNRLSQKRVHPLLREPLS